MRYALSNESRIEATPKAKGICQCCGSDLIAKCGTQKIWHWAHKGKRNCDHWWENETQWHRDWKDNFPKEWQEVVHLSDDGEKHIADVKTPNGLVVEFQHSAISAEEKLSRETFYKNMIWVVDGLRLERDFPRFEKDNPGFQVWPNNKIYKIYWAEFIFPKLWLGRTVPVIFDWGYGPEPGSYSDKPISRPLICLLPQNDKYAAANCFSISRSNVSKMINNEQKLFIPNVKS